MWKAEKLGEVKGQSKPESLPHISICVCTFKRPAMLAGLLEALLRQITGDRFTYSIVVVDNDRQASACSTVEQFQSKHPGALKYCVETEQSIALARNRSVAQASGNLIAFIDDDEVPPDDWLSTMYLNLLQFGADGVLGPVEPRFAVAPPAWTVKAGVFDRPNARKYHTGMVLHCSQTGTGNVLLSRQALEDVEGPFGVEFGSGGEDIDFFRRAMSLGKTFVWCNEATVYETVPPERTRVSFQVKRALLRGKVSLATPAGSRRGIAKSMVACLLYSTMLPVLLVAGRHLFLRYLIKDCDHIGKLLALCGVSAIKQKYVVK